MRRRLDDLEEENRELLRKLRRVAAQLGCTRARASDLERQLSVALAELACWQARASHPGPMVNEHEDPEGEP